MSDSERRIIKLCKLHYKDIYPSGDGGWISMLKPLFKDIYGWDPDEFYPDFIYGAFGILLDIHLKIKHDMSGSEIQLKNIFKVSFNKSGYRQQDLPVERCVAELCGLIQTNLVMEDGVERYKL